jgi:hypothetical protein
VRISERGMFAARQRGGKRMTKERRRTEDRSQGERENLRKVFNFDFEQPKFVSRARGAIYEEITFISRRDRSLRSDHSMPNRVNWRGDSVSEGNATLRSRVQSEDGNHVKTTERVSALPEGKVSAVKYKGQTYYVYPTATKDRILCGTQAQFDAYKQALQAQRAKLTGPVFEQEIYGPHPILVQQFDGFGPLGE